MDPIRKDPIVGERARVCPCEVPADEGLRERPIASTRLYEGKILQLRRDEVLLPDGTRAFREVVEHRGGVGVLLVEGDDVVLVRQFRYPYGCSVLEIPAGKLERGEDPLTCAARELSEETGYQASSFRFLGRVYPSPGYTNEVLYLYLARDPVPGVAHPDEGEALRIERYSLDRVRRMLADGEIVDAKTRIALQTYFLEELWQTKTTSSPC